MLIITMGKGGLPGAKPNDLGGSTLVGGDDVIGAPFKNN
jgi:hypothetical protein